jgi:hypothetical protein
LATQSAHRPDSKAKAIDASRHVGEGEAIESPTAAAKVINTNAVAAATTAPAITGPQWM